MQLMFFRVSSEGFAVTNGQNFAGTNPLSFALMLFKKNNYPHHVVSALLFRNCKFRKLPLVHDCKLLVWVRHLTGN